MKPDPYKTKASRAWKKKHLPKNVQQPAPSGMEDAIDDAIEDTIGDTIEDAIEGDAGSDGLEHDTNLLLDLEKKLIVTSDHSIIENSVNSNKDLKFASLELDFTVKNNTKSKSFKGFHNPIFSMEKISSKSSPPVPKVPIETPSTVEIVQKPTDLEEWLDDILG